ncbi:MAG TPA: carbon storage regulator [Planctomycetaceae bacterium]|nr:carbon storage regulator [Planctomycetaceae bacterium]
MLTITRQVNEGLVIGDNLRVTVLEIHEDHVRLAIENPHDEPSYWEEIVYWEQAADARLPVGAY